MERIVRRIPRSMPGKSPARIAAMGNCSHLAAMVDTEVSVLGSLVGVGLVVAVEDGFDADVEVGRAVLVVASKTGGIL